MRSIMAACLVVGVISGSTESPEELNAKVSRRLFNAKQERDVSAYPIAHEVLLDMTGHEYKYLRDARLEAFDYIRATGDTRAVPLLQEIAKLPSVDEDSLEAVLDAYAISGALSALINFGSEEAAELSLRHVFSHPFVQITALRNLKDLKVWEATPQIEVLFCSTRPVGDNHVELGLAAEFLQASPETSRAICPCIDEVGTAFKKEIEAPLEGLGTISYERLGHSMKALTARLGCPD